MAFPSAAGAFTEVSAPSAQRSIPAPGALGPEARNNVVSFFVLIPGVYQTVQRVAGLN